MSKTITYDDVEEGMVVICKKKEMLVTEVIEKQALGKDPEKMKIKLIGTDVKTGKPIKNAFRMSTTSIEVVSGAEDVTNALLTSAKKTIKKMRRRMNRKRWMITLMKPQMLVQL